MKNKILIFLILLCQNFNLQAQHFLIEFKPGLFLPTSTNFKDIYSKKGGIYGLELTGRLKGYWYGFLSADFFKKSGNTVNFDTQTHVKITNVGFGLKYFIPIGCGDLYLGIGALPTYLSTRDESAFVPNIHHKWGCGGIVKLGAIFDVTSCLFVDLFLDCAFAKVDFKFIPDQITQLHNAKLNNLWLGLGIGFRL